MLMGKHGISAPSTVAMGAGSVPVRTAPTAHNSAWIGTPVAVIAKDEDISHPVVAVTTTMTTSPVLGSTDGNTITHLAHRPHLLPVEAMAHKTRLLPAEAADGTGFYTTLALVTGMMQCDHDLVIQGHTTCRLPGADT